MANQGMNLLTSGKHFKGDSSSSTLASGKLTHVIHRGPRDNMITRPRLPVASKEREESNKLS